MTLASPLPLPLRASRGLPTERRRDVAASTNSPGCVQGLCGDRDEGPRVGVAGVVAVGVPVPRGARVGGQEERREEESQERPSCGTSANPARARIATQQDRW